MDGPCYVHVICGARFKLFLWLCKSDNNYHKAFNIKRTKTQKLNVLRLALPLSNPLMPVVKSRMKMVNNLDLFVVSTTRAAFYNLYLIAHELN